MKGSIMKMKLEHFTQLETSIKSLDTGERRLTYKKRLFQNADKVKDLDKRYRWDLFYATYATCAAALPIQALYSYLNDEHIDTALRKLVKPL